MASTKQRYVSTELAHFVGRGLAAEEQYRLLIKIINEGWITHPPHNPNISGNLCVNNAAKFSANEMYSPEIVCFCDIPLAELGIHISKYSSFGLSFSKDFVVKQGGCPVFYLPLQANMPILKDFPPDEAVQPLKKGGPHSLFEQIGKGEYFDRMIREYHFLMNMFFEIITDSRQISDGFQRSMELRRFFDFHIFSYIKFYDHTSDEEDDHNYYLEREWRIVGNLHFAMTDIETVFISKEYAPRFREDCPLYNSQLILV
ncbi:MAG: abortive infection system antitoxin AbiGi family protein [Syntrophobacterales bacterium]|jgi:hypothetical protein|nr:abortive infection system antitoxin AbiGi family protein [Syntrophobacterales bacterium]